MSIKNRHGDTRHYFKTYTNIFYLFFYNKIIKESTISRQLNIKERYDDAWMVLMVMHMQT
jgi:hypothetical protein